MARRPGMGLVSKPVPPVVGHNCWVLPEEERFVTPALIENTCLVGTPGAIAERLHAYDAAGLDEVVILPALAPRYDVIERVARDVLPALAGAFVDT